MRRHLTGAQVAELLGVSRKTVYRWADMGRIPPAWDWREDTIAPFVGKVGYLPKGPARRRWSRRYTIGRHRFDEIRNLPRRSTDSQ